MNKKLPRRQVIILHQDVLSKLENLIYKYPGIQGMEFLAFSQ